MAKTRNSTLIASVYGDRLTEQQLGEEQFDPNYGASRAIRTTAELVLIPKSTVHNGAGDSTASPVTTSQFEDAILCINLDSNPAAAVTFTLETWSPTLQEWFPIPGLSIPALSAAGQYAYQVQIIGEEVALKWSGAFTGGAVLLATS